MTDVTLSTVLSPEELAARIHDSYCAKCWLYCSSDLINCQQCPQTFCKGCCLKYLSPATKQQAYAGTFKCSDFPTADIQCKKSTAQYFTWTSRSKLIEISVADSLSDLEFEDAKQNDRYHDIIYGSNHKKQKQKNKQTMISAKEFFSCEFGGLPLTVGDNIALTVDGNSTAYATIYQLFQVGDENPKCKVLWYITTDEMKKCETMILSDYSDACNAAVLQKREHKQKSQRRKKHKRTKKKSSKIKKRRSKKSTEKSTKMKDKKHHTKPERVSVKQPLYIEMESDAELFLDFKMWALTIPTIDMRMIKYKIGIFDSQQQMEKANVEHLLRKKHNDELFEKLKLQLKCSERDEYKIYQSLEYMKDCRHSLYDRVFFCRCFNDRRLATVERFADSNHVSNALQKHRSSAFKRLCVQTWKMGDFAKFNATVDTMMEITDIYDDNSDADQNKQSTGVFEDDGSCIPTIDYCSHDSSDNDIIVDGEQNFCFISDINSDDNPPSVSIKILIDDKYVSTEIRTKFMFLEKCTELKIRELKKKISSSDILSKEMKEILSKKRNSKQMKCMNNCKSNVFVDNRVQNASAAILEFEQYLNKNGNAHMIESTDEDVDLDIGANENTSNLLDELFGNEEIEPDIDELFSISSMPLPMLSIPQMNIEDISLINDNIVEDIAMMDGSNDNGSKIANNQRACAPLITNTSVRSMDVSTNSNLRRHSYAHSHVHVIDLTADDGNESDSEIYIQRNKNKSRSRKRKRETIEIDSGSDTFELVGKLKCEKRRRLQTAKAECGSLVANDKYTQLLESSLKDKDIIIEMQRKILQLVGEKKILIKKERY